MARLNFPWFRFKKVPAKTDTHRRRGGPKLSDVTQNGSTNKNVGPSKENILSYKPTTHPRKTVAAASDLNGQMSKVVISHQNGTRDNPIEPEILRLDQA